MALIINIEKHPKVELWTDKKKTCNTKWGSPNKRPRLKTFICAGVTTACIS